MILIAAALAFELPRLFVEAPLPDAPFVDVQVAVPLPDKLSSRDRAIAKIITELIYEGTAAYSRNDFREATIGHGLPLRALLLPDCIRLEMGLAPDNYRNGQRMLISALSEALFRDDKVADVLEWLPYENRSPWSIATDPIRLDFDKPAINPAEVRALYKRLFDPVRVSVCVSGPFEAGAPTNLWRIQGLDYRMQPIGRWPALAPPQHRMGHQGKVEMFELYDPVVWNPRDEAATARRILAVIALGVGKDSAAFKVLRQKMGISYREEAMISPIPGGLSTRILFARREGLMKPETLTDSIKQIKDEVGTWNEATLRRAQAMAVSIFSRGLDLNLLQFEPEGVFPVNSFRSETFLQAYWPTKTGRPWDKDKLLKQMALVGTDEFLQECKDVSSRLAPRAHTLRN